MNKKIINSYIKHKSHLIQAIHTSQKFDYQWFKNNSYDTWRHIRMYKLVDVLINKKDSWITIGDGRYGSDAHYLITKGVKNIISSDISDEQLKIAKKNKYITNCKCINAESIDLKDESVDYVFCKESFHHFPRPFIALYEMIRIANKGVVLLEPNDAKAMITNKFENSFETVGNYKYAISVREIEKVTNSIGIYGLAYKGIDDIYLVDGGRIKFNSFNLKVLHSKFKLFVMSVLKFLKIRDNSLICLVLFKEKPSKYLFNSMTSKGYKFIVNKINPYE